MEPPLTIGLLGGGRLEFQGRVRHRIQSRKAEALLAYLALFHRHPLQREYLADLLWPESERTEGLHSLSTSLWTLRDCIAELGLGREDVLQSDRSAIWLRPGAFVTDVQEFETAAQAGLRSGTPLERREHLIRCATLYPAELLPGHYDEWVLHEQSRLSALFEECVDRLSEECVRAGHPEEAIPAAEQSLRLDPCSEVASLRLMRLRAACGRPDLAAAHCRSLDRVLSDDARAEALAEISTASARRQSPSPPAIAPGSAGRRGPAAESPGGAVHLGSPYYVERDVDRELTEALEFGESVVLLKGSRQVGKTSLLARAAQTARETGARVAVTPLQVMQASQTESLERFLQTMAEMLAERLELPSPTIEGAERGANLGFWRFLRSQVLGAPDALPLVWIIDDVDRLFGCPFGEEVFALIRSWHNERAFDPAGPWSSLTTVLAYSTEAYLFVRDLNQSPFNVGKRLAVQDFSLEQVHALAERYRVPLSSSETDCFYRLLGGHPYLSRLALVEMVRNSIAVSELMRLGPSDEWVFGAHLRRLRGILTDNSELRDAVQGVIKGAGSLRLETFHRLRSAGILSGDSERSARMRCGLYAAYVGRMG